MRMQVKKLFCAALVAAVEMLAAASAFADESFVLPGTAFTLASGNPSVQTWRKGETAVPVWSFSGAQKGQSVSAVTPCLPAEARGVKIELLVVNEDASADDSFFDVWRTDVTELADGMPATRGKPLRSRLAAKPWTPRRIVTETFLVVRGGAPLAVRVWREPGDAGDTFERPAGLLQVRVTPLAEPPAKPVAVEGRPGYNSWPMIQSTGGRLVCLYSRGKGHTIGDGDRDAFARTSLDGGKTWQDEVCVANDPLAGEVAIGKGTDLDGAALFWVRCLGRPRHHDLYRTLDGVAFEKIASPAFDPFPMQITDVFHVDGRLMALWFATNYKDGPHAWGTLASDDNGRTWRQTTVERPAELRDLPTEPCVVNLGGGRLLGLARSEDVNGDSTASQFQLTSTDGGATWQKTKTNIRDVRISSPSLVYDAATKRVFVYYYERGRHVAKRRVADADYAFAHPLDWPDSEGLFLGDEERPHDAGNVNAVEMGGRHYLTYYSGTRSQATVYVAEAGAE